MDTVVLNPKDVEKKWYVLDAKDAVLGRLASKAAHILMGKNKAVYSPSHDVGDFVVVVNADQIRLTGRKAETKEYFSHSMYAGGGRILTFKQLMERDASLPIHYAVKGMLPKNSRGRAIIKKLFVYKGEQHPHGAQKPQPLSVKD